jgi:uncharacterized repeat protein (TIGR03803 family)
LPDQLIQGSDGNFYGTSALGGANGHGNIFEMAPSGTLTVLYSFTGGADGCRPQGPVFRDSNGDIYGTTYQCSDPKCRCGAFFKLDTNNTLTVLHTFTRGADGKGEDGEFPSNNIVSVNGELYGTTESGGSTGFGVIYKITKGGHYTVAYDFGLDQGQGSQGDLTRDSAGNIYSEIHFGLGGALFELDTAGIFSVLHTFAGGADDGSGPVGRLLREPTGTITGAAQFFNVKTDLNRCGLIYRLESDGTVTALHHFFGGAGGCSPQTGLIDVGGALYGTTALGGDASCPNYQPDLGCGVLFQISRTGAYSVVHTWTGPDGGLPQDELTKGNDGNVYGITKQGGTGSCDNGVPGCGVIFKYTPASQ